MSFTLSKPCGVIWVGNWNGGHHITMVMMVNVNVMAFNLKNLRSSGKEIGMMVTHHVVPRMQLATLTVSTEVVVLAADTFVSEDNQWLISLFGPFGSLRRSLRIRRPRSHHRTS